MAIGKVVMAHAGNYAVNVAGAAIGQAFGAKIELANTLEVGMLFVYHFGEKSWERKQLIVDWKESNIELTIKKDIGLEVSSPEGVSFEIKAEDGITMG